MPSMNIVIGDDDAWEDLADADKLMFPEHLIEVSGVAVLDHGMASGKPSIAFRIDLPNGKSIIAQTSLELFLGSARVFAAKYGGPTHV